MDVSEELVEEPESSETAAPSAEATGERRPSALKERPPAHEQATVQAAAEALRRSPAATSAPVTDFSEGGFETL